MVKHNVTMLCTNAVLGFLIMLLNRLMFIDMQ